MQRILVGLLALFVLGAVVGGATHWFVGVALVVVPILVTFTNLKMRRAYRLSTDETMSKALSEQEGSHQ